MKQLKKIGILDNPRSMDSMLRFDAYEGYDQKEISKHMALKINEIIEFLKQNPDVRNEIPIILKKEGKQVVHEHDYKLLQRFGNRGYYECQVCGETLSKILQGA